VGGSEKGGIAGDCVGSVVACGARGFLASRVPVSGLEMELEFGPVLGHNGRVELAPFSASEVVEAQPRVVGLVSLSFPSSTKDTPSSIWTKID
jgi:hypothetical protein